MLPPSLSLSSAEDIPQTMNISKRSTPYKDSLKSSSSIKDILNDSETSTFVPYTSADQPPQSRTIPAYSRSYMLSTSNCTQSTPRSTPYRLEETPKIPPYRTAFTTMNLQPPYRLHPRENLIMFDEKYANFLPTTIATDVTTTTIAKSSSTPTSPINNASAYICRRNATISPIQRIFKGINATILDCIIDHTFEFLGFVDEPANTFLRHLLWKKFKPIVSVQNEKKDRILAKKCLTAIMRMKYPDYIPSKYKKGKELRNGVATVASPLPISMNISNDHSAPRILLPKPAGCNNDPYVKSTRKRTRNRNDTRSVLCQAHTIAGCKYGWLSYMTSNGTLKIVYSYIDNQPFYEGLEREEIKKLRLNDPDGKQLHGLICKVGRRNSSFSFSRNASSKKLSRKWAVPPDASPQPHELDCMQNFIGCDEILKRVEELQRQDQNCVTPSAQRAVGILPYKTELHYEVCPLRTLSSNQLETYIKFIRKEMKCHSLLVTFFMPLLRKLMDHQSNRKIFNTPVDPLVLNIPTYFSIIEHPMDLGTVKSKLEHGDYENEVELEADIKLVFMNAMTFNASTHYVHQNAQKLLNYFTDEFYSLRMKYVNELKIREAHCCYGCYGRKCVVCLQGCLEYQTQQHFCSGSCMQVINKNAYYYVTEDGTRIWCTKCYNKYLKGHNKGEESMENTRNESITTNQEDGAEEEEQRNSETEGTERKCELQSRTAVLKEPAIGDVFDSLVKEKSTTKTEPWVKCAKCSQWTHAVCGLVNVIDVAYHGKGYRYICPLCTQNERKEEETMTAKALSKGTTIEEEKTFKPYDASCLEECALSRAISKRLFDALERAGESQVYDSLLVRVVTRENETQHVPLDVHEVFKQNQAYCDKVVSADSFLGMEDLENNSTTTPAIYPTKIPYRSRTIYLFQKQNNVDLFIFAVFVQEYPSLPEMPGCNKNTAYIAYIDSVKYFEPANLRTFVYYQLLLAYFDYLRQNDYQRIHLWSCPPQRNINYVFWCHPKGQKTPNIDMLRQWYIRLLNLAQEEKIVTSYTTLYERYFAPIEEKLKVKQKEKEKKKTCAEEVITSSFNGIVTRRVSLYECDIEKCRWPGGDLPPAYDGDYWPGELSRVIKKLSNAKKNKRQKAVKSKIPKKNKASLHHDVSNVSSCSKLEEEALSSSNSLRPPDILLHDVFISALQGVKVYKDDIFVIDLAPNDRDDTAVPEEATKQENALCCSPFSSSRFAFHQLCLQQTYQFDTVRHSQYSTMMLLYHMLNDITTLTPIYCLCNLCGLLITRVSVWKCDYCSLYQGSPHVVCDWCYRNSTHQHALTFGILSIPKDPQPISSSHLRLQSKTKIQTTVSA